MAFIEWILDPNTTPIEKGMTNLKKRYMELMTELTLLEDLLLFEPKLVSEPSLDVHIRSLIKKKNLVFKTPKTVDPERLHIFDSLEA